jgi:hypothetical protein
VSLRVRVSQFSGGRFASIHKSETLTTCSRKYWNIVLKSVSY